MCKLLSSLGQFFFFQNAASSGTTTPDHRIDSTYYLHQILNQGRLVFTTVHLNCWNELQHSVKLETLIPLRDFKAAVL